MLYDHFSARSLLAKLGRDTTRGFVRHGLCILHPNSSPESECSKNDKKRGSPTAALITAGVDEQHICCLECVVHQCSVENMQLQQLQPRVIRILRLSPQCSEFINVQICVPVCSKNHAGAAIKYVDKLEVLPVHDSSNPNQLDTYIKSARKHLGVWIYPWCLLIMQFYVLGFAQIHGNI